MFGSIHRLIARVYAAIRPSAETDLELDTEFETHIQLRAEEHIRRGVLPAEAQRLARVELGGLTQLREAHREVRALPFLDTLRQDLRYTARTMRLNPSFAIFVILIIGLGVGACTTIFSMVNALLLRPLPFTDAGQLVWISTLGDDRVAEWSIQVNHFLDLRAQTKSFSDLSAYSVAFEPGDDTLIIKGRTERLSGLRVAQNLFPFLGVRPMLGRTFNSEECKWNAPGAALLSHGLWTRLFASDPNVVGQRVTLDKQPVTIIGVMPAGFDFASVFIPGNHIDLFFPMPLVPETNRWGNVLGVVGRLKPGVRLEQARAEFQTLAAQLEKQHPERNSLRPVLASLSQHVTGRVQSALVVLAWAVGIVMLIVCANVANLQLARSAARQKEMAIRVAIGAGRRRLIRQMLTESLALACAGGVLGIILATAATRLLAGLDAFNIPLLSAVRMDAASLLFSVLIAVLSGLLFGIAPALQIQFSTVHDALKDSSRAATGSQRHIWVRNVLVVSEIVFACVLLVGAGLLTHSFLKVLDVSLGFQPERAATLRIDENAGYSSIDQRNAFYNQVLERTRAITGVSAAGLADVLPLVGDRSWQISAPGKYYEPGHYPEGFIRLITDGYFQAMGIPLRAGREISQQDTPATERVAVINETAARTFWSGQNPIGQILYTDGGPGVGRRVVGVVADVRHGSLEKEAGCEIYLPVRQRDDRTRVYLVVRSALPPSALAGALRAALHPLAPELSTTGVRTFEDVVDSAVSPRRFVVLLLSGFSVFALILAALGIYAVISYSVSQRTTELGIRMALGASAAELQSGVILRALQLAMIGILIGSLVSWSLSRALGSLLFGVTATDPATFLATLLVLGAVAVLAGYFPALRVSKIDPMIALRTS